MKAVASFAIIRAILEDIPLGIYRTEIGLELRQALFLNSVLYNCETWHGLKVTDIAEIKLIDNQLLRYICKAQAKTPQEFLFLETGAIPIDFIISSRRISYLYEILNRSDNELLKRVYLAQLDNPSPGDFVNLVETDCIKIGITTNQDWVCNTPKYIFQKWLRQKVKEAAIKELTSIQASHQKVRNIVYNSLETQPYLNNSMFSNSDCELLLALRSHSVRGIKSNFSSMHKKDLSCPLLCDPSNPQDEQSHLLCCKKILEQLNADELQAIKISDYSHLYGSLDEQLFVTHIFKRLLQVREQLQTHIETNTLL